MLAQLHTVRRKLERLNVAKGIRNVKERTEEKAAIGTFETFFLCISACLCGQTYLRELVKKQAVLPLCKAVRLDNRINYVPLASRV